MKHLLFALLLLAPVAAMAAAPLAGSRPNIIFVLTDDQGYGDISAHGNPILKTPNLDRLRADAQRPLHRPPRIQKRHHPYDL